MLRYDKGAVRGAFDEWVAHVGEIRNRSPVMKTISARALRAALDDMTGDDSGGELVPVLCTPGKLISQWCHRQRRICGPAGNHDIRARSESFDDRLRTDVCVRRKHV